MKRGLHKLPQKPSNMASQFISLQHEIQGDFVGAENYKHGVLGQTGHSRRLPDQRWHSECWKYETLQKLRRAFRKKWRVMLSAGLVLLHDKARPHTVRRSTHLLQEFSWEMFNHSLYGPDLVLSDFHLFVHLKKSLSGQRQSFQNDRWRLASHSGSNPRRQTSTTKGIQKLPHGMTNVSIPKVNMLKINSTLAVSVPTNSSIKLGFVSINDRRETYFMDTLCK